jgi:hypothetical protein
MSFVQGQPSEKECGGVEAMLGEKTALFAPFIYKNQHFTKTGSGQT